MTLQMLITSFFSPLQLNYFPKSFSPVQKKNIQELLSADLNGKQNSSNYPLSICSLHGILLSS